jgi:hypothetical protein
VVQRTGHRERLAIGLDSFQGAHAGRAPEMSVRFLQDLPTLYGRVGTRNGTEVHCNILKTNGLYG